MVKKILMGSVVTQILDDFAPEIPENKRYQVENGVSLRLQSTLGDNWAVMPVSGPTMILLTLILNYMLLPLGITPVMIADKVITKSKEMELGERFADLIESAKVTATNTGEFTQEKLKDLQDYLEEKGVTEKVRELADSSVEMGKQALSTGVSKGKRMFDSVKTRFQTEEEKDNETT
ncbi:MAG: hypothetical protein ACXAE3_15090 [Candidatus Kariarchaeaceae archaeon]|jgi:hypothetical protein